MKQITLTILANIFGFIGLILFFKSDVMAGLPAYLLFIVTATLGTILTHISKKDNKPIVIIAILGIITGACGIGLAVIIIRSLP